MHQEMRKRKRGPDTSLDGGSESPSAVAVGAPGQPVVVNGEQQPVQCGSCKKKYRQHNSYYKHLYEHHPFWNHVASEFQLSKHGQVMLMQSAEVLLSFKKPDVYGDIPPVRF
mmetsp:Transcript_5132/g.15659  ORF Transcript_5132/g.15659 Transcript_5132/m.15659 type:complete len:112 (+) Transcript_5132:289-624(+)